MTKNKIKSIAAFALVLFGGFALVYWLWIPFFSEQKRMKKEAEKAPDKATYYKTQIEGLYAKAALDNRELTTEEQRSVEWLKAEIIKLGFTLNIT